MGNTFNGWISPEGLAIECIGDHNKTAADIINRYTYSTRFADPKTSLLIQKWIHVTHNNNFLGVRHHLTQKQIDVMFDLVKDSPLMFNYAHYDDISHFLSNEKSDEKLLFSLL